MMVVKCASASCAPGGLLSWKCSAKLMAVSKQLTAIEYRCPTAAAFARTTPIYT